MNPVEIEQRKRVFWIAYLLDKEYVELSSLNLWINWLKSLAVFAFVLVDHPYRMMMT